MESGDAHGIPCYGATDRLSGEGGGDSSGGAPGLPQQSRAHDRSHLSIFGARGSRWLLVVVDIVGDLKSGPSRIWAYRVRNGSSGSGVVAIDIYLAVVALAFALALVGVVVGVCCRCRRKGSR